MRDHLDDLLREAPVAIMLSRDGILLDANTAYIRMLGYESADEITGHPIMDHIAPSARSTIASYWAAHHQGVSLPVVYETLAARKDGTELPVIARIASSSGPQGNLTITFVEDASLQAKARDAFRQNEESFHRMFEWAPVGVVLVSLDYRLLRCNAEYCRFIGYPEEEMLGRTFLEFTHPEDLQRGLPEAKALLDGALDVGRIEKRYLRKDGKTVWGEVAIRMLRDSEGRPVHYLTSVQDMTARKDAEAALRHVSTRHEAILCEVPDIIMEVDNKHMYTWANPAGLEFFGKDVVGTEASSYFLGAQDTYASVHPVFQGDPGTVYVESWQRRQDGARRLLAWWCRSLRDQDGQVLGALSTARDITEHRQAEEERRRLQESLFQAQKLESIGTLAGGIAHDFNNLLAGLLGGLCLMESHLRKDRALDLEIPRMKALVERGADLAKRLLVFARGGIREPKPVNILNVVDKTTELVAHARKDLVCEISPSTSTSVVLADRGQLEQVLMNLLLNASQAMPHGGTVFLRIDAAEVAPGEAALHQVTPGPFVRVSVTDTGSGMDASTRERIFDPFFTTKAATGGTGLGLASSYSIVKGHGGFITVTSELGRGSTFSVFLPTTDEPVVDDPHPMVKTQTGHETILLVDDEEMVVSTYGELLRALGYTVLLARNGHEAMQVFGSKQEQVALILLDLVMPGMTGGQTFDALRAMAPDVKVLLCSGYGIDGHARDVLARGAVGFIQKPFDSATLSVKLREILG